ncbi:MAG: spermidine/putrescine ABC transporter substrate-binding protein [Actinomycetota bacterium]
MRDEWTPGLDPALVRGLTEPRYSRRRFLRDAGITVGGLSLASILAACGTKGVATSSGTDAPNAGMGTPDWWNQQTLNDKLRFANWAYYIDTAHGEHPSLVQFTQDTGIQVEYSEAVNDNISFYSKIRQDLAQGNDIGYDLIVSTDNDPPISQMVTLGWGIPLDQSKMTNYYKYSSKLIRDPSFDPGNVYTMGWQSGYTCMAYNSKYITEPITSLQSLFDSKYEGKIGMMGIASELGSIGLLAIGKDPKTSTPDEWQQAADKLMEQKPLVRSYYDASYLRALKNEDIWITMAWSGDIFYAATYQGYDTLKVVIPDEGAMFWTDYMMIPYTAENPLDAMTYMDSVFDPHVAAEIADYVGYVCPVPSAQEIIRSELNDPVVADSPTVFPTPAIEAVTHYYPAWSDPAVVTGWNDTFVPIFEGG